jgi:hypothetical protein
VTTPSSIESQAESFATELTATVRALVPDCRPFEALVNLDRGDAAGRFSVRQYPETGIVLTVDGEPLLTLVVQFHCEIDSVGRYLAVHSSKIKVMAAGDAEPLLRYEFLRDAVGDMPSAHIQIHAHRDAFTYVMARAGERSDRGKRRSRRPVVPRLEHLHLPVGGPRFRPCIEDVLEMLVQEFGVDRPDGALQALRAGRESWRRKQIASVVRDAPEDAARVLRELGYDVHGPQDVLPADNIDRLQRL